MDRRCRAKTRMSENIPKRLAEVHAYQNVELSQAERRVE
jgi:hypothetical protein